MTAETLHAGICQRWGEIVHYGGKSPRPTRIVVSLEIYGLLLEFEELWKPGAMNFFGILVDTNSKLPMWSFIFYS